MMLSNEHVSCSALLWWSCMYHVVHHVCIMYTSCMCHVRFDGGHVCIMPV